MALDDYLEPEVAVAVAVTAAIASPPVRKVLRQGAVYGLAGLLLASDRLSAWARSAAETAQQVRAGIRTQPTEAPAAAVEPAAS